MIKPGGLNLWVSSDGTTERETIMADIYYGQSVRAVCTDGVTRAATPRRYSYDGSLAADTFFSVPAFVRANGRTVRGYIGNDGEGCYFRAYTYRKNHDAIKRI